MTRIANGTGTPSTATSIQILLEVKGVDSKADKGPWFRMVFVFCRLEALEIPQPRNMSNRPNEHPISIPPGILTFISIMLSSGNAVMTRLRKIVWSSLKDLGTHHISTADAYNGIIFGQSVFILDRRLDRMHTGHASVRQVLHRK